MSGSTIKVQITWTGSDGFLIYASDPFGRPYPARTLAYTLFAFDERSFFGTNVQLVERDFQECISLTPLAAVCYFSNPSYNELVSIEWPPEWSSLQQGAQAIHRSLETAGFTLDGSRGLSGQLVWKLEERADTDSDAEGRTEQGQSQEQVQRHVQGNVQAEPVIEAEALKQEQEYAEDDSALSEGPASYQDLPYFAEWVDRTVWECIETSTDVKRAFIAVTGSHPALVSNADETTIKATIEATDEPSGEPHDESSGEPFAFMDEEEWKIAVGLKQDDMPFTFALQLLDPYSSELDEETEPAEFKPSDKDAAEVAETADEDWILRIILQDKANPTLQMYIPEALEAFETMEVNMRAPSLEKTVVPAWIPYFDRVHHKIMQCVHLVPWLAADNKDGILADGSDIEVDGYLELKSHLTSDEALLFLEEGSIRLADAGIQVYVPSWWEEIRRAAVKMKANVKSASSTSASASGAGQKPMFGLAQTVDFDWRIAIGDVEMSEAEFLRLVAQKRKLVRFRGRFIRVDSEEFRAIAARMKKTKTGKGLTLRDVFELHLFGGSMMDIGSRSGTSAYGTGSGDELEGQDEQDALRVMMEVELDSTLAHMMTRLTHTKEIPNAEVPETFQGKLRPYQQIGVSWLTFLRTYGLGACLADDMGLGKTIQYIAYLLTAQEAYGKSSNQPIGDQAGGTQAPSLLICPTSVIGNWQKEIARFAPSLRVYLHYGSRRSHNAEFVSRTEDADVVLTSYTLAQMDEEDFSQVTFDSICLDEAQNIKNPHTKQAQSIRKFDARHRIAMTGTPIENRLTELWSIFDFLNPGYLGSLHGFQEKFVTPIERHQDMVKLEQVKRLVHPLLLRRVKQDPAIQLDLPEKVESKVFVSLTPEQAALYENVVTDMLGKLDKLTGIERSGIILTTLLKLKQICNHPVNFLKTGDLFAEPSGNGNGVRKENGAAGEGEDKDEAVDGRADWNEQGIEALGEAVGKTEDGKADGNGNEGGKESGGKERSNKLTRLIEMVSELREEGDSCLIFTQFVEMGQLLREALTKSLDEKVLFLHGGLNKTRRDTMINDFQEGKAGIFILSLKAGGVGLNLTAASHVFHFDRWWNPAVENQATDRAFRIGQTKQVEVHKFVTLGTLEERIDEMIEQKQALSDQIVGGGESWITQMPTNELRDLFVLRREWVDMDA